jgi:hypothetical protein
MPFDLVLRGGRVIDPSQKLDAVADVAFAAGKVVMVGNELKADPGTDVRDVSGYIVTPGLIDLHTLLGWYLARHRRRGVLPHLRRHHSGRHRQCQPESFRGLSQACDRAEPGPHSRLSACLAHRHLRLFASGRGRRERGDAADESDRRRQRGGGQPRRHRRAACHLEALPEKPGPAQ